MIPIDFGMRISCHERRHLRQEFLLVDTAHVTHVEFREGFVDADGFRIRYLVAGEGEPLVVMHGGGGLRYYRSHDLLAAKRRVLLFEAPGFGASTANERSQSMAALADTIALAVRELGIERYDLQGTSFGGKLALWLAVQHPESVRALVLVSPAAIRPEGAQAPRAAGGPPLTLYAHPERVPAQPPPDPEVTAKQMALTRRIMGPPRDEELEDRLSDLPVPVLVVVGTEDRMLPPEMARIYREKIPNCNLVFVYDAAHEVDADRPEAFVSLVDDFLERQEAFLVNRTSGLLNP
jgi:pimeloyl-ACP methyl ester carboxylesterase